MLARQGAKKSIPLPTPSMRGHIEVRGSGQQRRSIVTIAEQSAQSRFLTPLQQAETVVPWRHGGTRPVLRCVFDRRKEFLVFNKSIIFSYNEITTKRKDNTIEFAEVNGEIFAFGVDGTNPGSLFSAIQEAASSIFSCPLDHLADVLVFKNLKTSNNPKENLEGHVKVLEACNEIADSVECEVFDYVINYSHKKNPNLDLIAFGKLAETLGFKAVTDPNTVRVVSQATRQDDTPQEKTKDLVMDTHVTVYSREDEGTAAPTALKNQAKEAQSSTTSAKTSADGEKV